MQPGTYLFAWSFFPRVGAGEAGFGAGVAAGCGVAATGFFRVNGLASHLPLSAELDVASAAAANKIKPVMSSS